ncbi:MAG TPA: hypothetical protein VK442_08250 [Xanthobacteraceae bacterium]|nr:hypothetical protein [Xanthobacteraceae bacterium]
MQALGNAAPPLAVGVALDAERLGGVGEVPVGADEFADIWQECVGRTLLTTNVGSRVNVRLYRPAPVITIPGGATRAALATAKTGLAAAFKPFLTPPGGKPRPLVAYVEFELGSRRPPREQRALLRILHRYVRRGGIAASRVHHLGLNVRIGWGPKGRNAAIRAIDLAHAVGIQSVSIDGVVRKEADRVVSLPGLLDYLAPGLVAQILRHAQQKGVRVHPLNRTDPDTVACTIWSALNTARAMGLDLGKYGLFPLTLEECDAVVGRVRQWFPDWSAAPVFYVDQGTVSRSRVYVGHDRAKGLEAWLRLMAKHHVEVVLIDTVDKAAGWKILRSGNDPKGLLGPRQIARLTALGERLGIKVLWAGGITLEQINDFGKLGVFGIYVTTAAAEPVPVEGAYKRDPGMASGKQPTFKGVLKVKTLLEAGFLGEHVGRGPGPVSAAERRLQEAIKQAGQDEERLSRILPAAWRAWWAKSSSRGRSRASRR